MPTFWQNNLIQPAKEGPGNMLNFLFDVTYKEKENFLERDLCFKKMGENK